MKRLAETESVSEAEYEVVVIGMGPGGEFVAAELARAGVAVAAVEDSLVGGECPYWGCIPSKMMIRAGNLLAEGRRIPGLAGAAEISPSWVPVARRIRDEATDDWDDKVAADRFTGLGGTLYRGHGKLAGPGTVTVGRDVLRARRGIVINAGSVPSIPPIDGLADTPYWTNHQAIECDQLPESLLVLGGGAIGAELAQVYARFGTAVTVIEASGRILPAEEPESAELISKVFAAEGIWLRTGATAQAVSYDGDKFTVLLAEGRPGGASEISGDRLLVATGRRADLANLGLASIGLDEHARYLQVDGSLQAAPGVWALGDIVGHGAFTHMSMYHGGIIADQLLGRPFHPAEHHAVPRVTFTDPEVGSVGLTQAQAEAALGDRVTAATAQLPQSTRGWIHKAGNEGFIKLVADQKDAVLVGATSAGPCGGEVLSMLTLAVHARIPVPRLKEMIYAYPTFHRAVSEALAKLS